MVVKIAHRGDPLLVRENTLPSLASAVEGGADWIEVDVKLTRDGVPVLLHDDTLRRLWRVDRRVGDLVCADLAGATAAVDRGEWCIPTLRDAVEFVLASPVSLMLDLPGVPEGEASAALVRELGCLDRVVFTGDPRALAGIRAAAPKAVLAMSWKSPLRPPADLMRSVRPDFLNFRHIWVTRRRVGAAHAAGLGVSAWTVDRPRRMASLARKGVDAIITNDIRALVRTLGEATPPGPSFGASEQRTKGTNG
ncbi:glycerophosphodiester phosphodiesterase [Yinghuangia soli]|uniref:Glycerophosphodiester phosphodiesterase n=1 Tax=Yinghuangia soli TaxID=2908204 RepID=A0AA41Q0T7_9ACTN|nr:glycerophosphodiester phosphodiesterase [Yinghuangia soli]MCF2527967.1 glycerophosphodiester phosphodiesterase [Yinghuangia soli]